MPRYGWNTAKVGIKQQSINLSTVSKFFRNVSFS